MSDLREARQIAEAFDQVSLVQVTESKNMFYIELHDLVWDISMRKASDKDEVRGWFRTILDKCIPKTQDASADYENPLNCADKNAVQPRRSGISI